MDPQAPQERALLDREMVDLALGALAVRDRSVIEMRFGLNGNGEHLLREVGDAIGVCKDRARCIETKALRRMRGRLHYARLARR
jgi:DNA-directed RNA polymerase sigma subunit (sigma70/sigma32)